MNQTIESTYEIFKPFNTNQKNKTMMPLQQFKNRSTRIRFKHVFHVVLFLAMVLLQSQAMAQVPQGIPFQAIARDANGSALISQAISLRISIHDNSLIGPVVYQETHTITTSSLGLFTLGIGEGTPVSGSLAAVAWSSGNKYLQVEMDPSGGTNYTDMGTTHLQTVPYAFHAGSSADNVWGSNGSNIYNLNNDHVGIGTNNPLNRLHVKGNDNVFKIEGTEQNRVSMNLNGSLGSAWTIGTDIDNSGGNNLYFYQGGCCYRAVILGDGRFGIGTITPQAMLDVAGSIRMADGNQGNGKILMSDANGIGSWQSATSFTGPAGADGKTILNGTSNPGSGIGNDGDFYLNTSTNLLFGPKAAGAWGSGVSLVGPAGATGATGATGPTGAAGTNGKTILNGTTNPIAGNGVDGDFYLNTTTKQLFGPKTAGTWGSGTSLIGPTGSTGATGAAGTNGKTILNGTTNPTAGTGTDGDFYINTATNQIFGPKTSGVWGSGTSMVGSGITNGTAAGNTPYWNGTAWVTNNSNIFNTGGNVGIGMNPPSSTMKLDVNGSARIKSNLVFNTAGGIINYGAGGTLWFRSNPTVGDESNYVDRMVLSDNGDLGIATTNLPARLNVGGGLYCSGSTGNSHLQGSYLEWNKNGAGGMTYLLNQKGLGAGGFVIGEIDNTPANNITERIRIDASGNVGIGTSTPGKSLDVNGRLRFKDHLIFNSANGVINWGNSGNLYFRTNNTLGDESTFADKMVLTNNGDLAIGSSTPATGYKLTVNGKAICTELRVQATPFPDYVFEDSYALKSLDEVEAHINTYHRLPNMPPATEVESEGMNVGGIQLKLVEKVEEATLYILQLNKENKELKERLNALEEKLNNLSK